MFDTQPYDIINSILYHLSLDDVRNLWSSCKYIKCHMTYFPWHIYFTNRVHKAELYKDITVDTTFMKLHGKYLINITTTFDLKQWLHFFPTILEITTYNKNSEFLIEIQVNDFWHIIEIFVRQDGSIYTRNVGHMSWTTPDYEVNTPLLDELIKVLLASSITCITLFHQDNILIRKMLCST